MREAAARRMKQHTDHEGIRIVLTDDHELVRAGMKSMLTEVGKYSVVAEASNGKEAVAAVLKFKPDLLILDISMPLMNGTEVIRQIKQRSDNTKVLVMTMHREEPHVRMAMSCGADGYILKDDSWEELSLAIRHVLSGKIYLSPVISSKVADDFASGSAPANSVLDKLTPRERQVLKLIAEGLKNREIAEFLSISVKTVDKHRANLMRKLELRNSAAVTTFAIECGIVGQ